MHTNRRHQLIFLVFSISFLQSWSCLAQDWIIESHGGFEIFYTDSDKENKKEYLPLIDNGITVVRVFFESSFKKTFEIFIHPNRESLDRQWQTDWNMPNFKSQCWMVASGVANKLDLVSPKAWNEEACEHNYGNKAKTQRLITHELFHVYHGQLNESPDFSDINGIDWFVEGFATYASGQCDSTRIAEVKNAVANNAIPTSLDKFWTGKLRYGLSGSLVLYIDKKYGRNKLKELLPFNQKVQILDRLETSETEFLNDWKMYMKKF